MCLLVCDLFFHFFVVNERSRDMFDHDMREKCVK